MIVKVTRQNNSNTLTSYITDHNTLGCRMFAKEYRPDQQKLIQQELLTILWRYFPNSWNVTTELLM